MNSIKSLTKQEGIVLTLVAQGKRNAEIAQELYLSVRTVESYLYRIYQKLDVSSRTEAAIYCFRSSLASNSEYSGNTDYRENSSNYYKVM